MTQDDDDGGEMMLLSNNLMCASRNYPQEVFLEILMGREGGGFI